MHPVALIQVWGARNAIQRKGYEGDVLFLCHAAKHAFEIATVVGTQVRKRLKLPKQNFERGPKLPGLVDDASQVIFYGGEFQTPHGVIGAQTNHQHAGVDAVAQIPSETSQPACRGVTGASRVDDLVTQACLVDFGLEQCR